jgi:hypothetical protein
MPARIFFSYAGADEYWVQLFKEYFKPRNVKIIDYQAENIVQFGPLQEALNERIEGSAVVVAFVSKKYTTRQWTVAEWERGLQEVDRRRLIFVPIMLDVDAIEWWQSLRRNNHLTSLSRDYQYADFTDSSGGPVLPGPRNPEAIKKIADLAGAISEDLDRKMAPAPPPGTSSPMPASPPIVVLGHPTASSPQYLQTEVQQLVAALATDVVTWNDGWREPDFPRPALRTDANPIFVQPIPKAEASDYAADRSKIGKYLSKLGWPNSRVTLWLPKNYQDLTFEQACGVASVDQEGNPSKFPALRKDDPVNLASWLRTEILGAVSEDTMVLQVQGMGSPADSKPEIALHGKQITDQLKDQMWAIVTGLVKKPRPAPPPWQFWETMFKQQLEVLPGSRAIIAIHDLDIPPGPDRKVVQKKVELKFEQIHRDVEAVQQKIDRPLKLFCAALLVNNAQHLPFSNYPDDGRYKNWRILGFPLPDEDAPAGTLPPPDPASLAIFRTNLLAWAATQ